MKARLRASTAYLMRAALAATLFAGCTVFETQPDVTVALVTPLPTREAVLGIWVRAEVGDSAVIVVDGVERARVPIGDPAEVPIAGLPDGEHALRAEVSDEGRTLRSAAARFVVDRTPSQIVGVDPPLGVVAAGPFTARVTFDEQVEVYSTGYLDRPRFGSDEVSPISSADRRTLTFALPSVSSYGATTLFFFTRDAAGNTAEQVLTWRGSTFELELLEPATTRPLRGVVNVRATFQGPEYVYVSLAPGSQGSLLLRSGETGLLQTYWCQGACALVFSADGYEPIRREVTVDNAAPGLVECGTEGFGRWDGHIGSPVQAVFYEPVSRTGAPPFSTAIEFAPPPTVGPLPFIWYGSSPTVYDEAGNTTGPRDCEVWYWPWMRPQTDDNLAALAGARLACPLGELDLHRVELGAVAADPASATGLRLDVKVFAGGVPVATVPDTSRTGVIAGRCGPSALGWTEQRPGGSEHDVLSYTRASGLLAVEGLPAAAAAEVEAVSGTALAWSQVGTAGRELRVAWFGAADRLAPTDALEVLLEPGGTPRAAAVVDAPARIAYVASGPGHPHWLFDRQASAGALLPADGPLNADLAADASEPAAVSTATTDLVAWAEAGQVLVRARASGGGSYGPAQVLNADAAAPARAPRFSVSPEGPVLAFLEAEENGERLEVRRLVESGPGAGSWVPLHPIGPIADLKEPPGVAWPGVLWGTLWGFTSYLRYNE